VWNRNTLLYGYISHNKSSSIKELLARMDVLKRKCGFCSSSNNLTREHIFPNSVLKRYEDMLSINDKSEKTFKADLVVKDVCSICNNGVLSDLDAKFITIFDKYMHEPIFPGASVEFEYDYNDLLRELLKITYNSARASSDGIKSINVLKKYVPYILGKVNEADDVMLRLQIVTSSKKLNVITNEVEGMIEAKILRSAKIPYDGPQSSNFIVRLVAFNSFWFYLLLPIKKVSLTKHQNFLEGFSNWRIQPGLLVVKNQSSLSIPKEKTTYMHPDLLTGMIRKKA
jgi:hypothetical protein